MSKGREAPKRFYSSQDIMQMMSVGKTKALEYIHMFDRSGKVFHDGRILRVDAEAFDNYIKHYTRAI